MATQVTPSIDILRREVQAKYTELSDSPDLTYHFHHGRPLAEILGYQMDQVDAMPAQAVESFAGVGNPHGLGPVSQGETILDRAATIRSTASSPLLRLRLITGAES